MISRFMPKERIWPTIIVTVLTANVVLGIVLSRVASRGSSLVAEPDYYRKAVLWDSTLAQARRNAALGWRVTPSLTALGLGVGTARQGAVGLQGDSSRSPHAAGPGAAPGAVLSLDVRDAAGVPVRGAAVHVDAWQLAHGDEALAGTLAADGAGGYRAWLPMARAGRWEVRVDATRGADRFTATLRIDASQSAAGREVGERPGDALAARLAAGTRRERGTP